MAGDMQQTTKKKQTNNNYVTNIRFNIVCVNKLPIIIYYNINHEYVKALLCFKSFDSSIIINY